MNGFYFSVSKHIDFDSVMKKTADEPDCDDSLVSDIPGIDTLAGVRCHSGLEYSAELGLKEVS